MYANASPYKKIDWISTGFSKLNTILGGGVPTRKILEVSGQFSVGKTTLALSMVAQAQKEKYKCLWVDSEFSFDDEYATTLGVNCGKLELLQERFAEDALDAIEAWAEKNKNGLVVLDSVGALLPRQEAEKNAGEKVIGGQAKLIATFCRKIVPLLAINNVALVILNHQFTDLMSGKLKTSGGAKLEYSKSVWLMLRKASKRIMQGENQVGEIIEAEIRKNKLAGTSKQKVELQLFYGKGFSVDADLLQECIEKGIITKSSNSYLMDGVKLAVGMGKLRDAVNDSHELKLALQTKLEAFSAKHDNNKS